MCGIITVFVALALGLLFSGTLSTYNLVSDSVMPPFFVGMVPVLTPAKDLPITYDKIDNLEGKVAIVTGANIGVGYWTAHHLALHGATVVLACRSAEKCEAAAKLIRANLTAQQAPGRVLTQVVDTASLASVEKFTTEFKKNHNRLDIFVQNAGIGLSDTHTLVDGIERTFYTNHLGHFKMTKDLEDLIVKTANEQGFASVVMVSSASHYDAFAGGAFANFSLVNDPREFGGNYFYGVTKFANVLFMLELNSRLSAKSPNVYINACHPGFVATNIFNSALERTNESWFHRMLIRAAQLLQRFQWTSEEGAYTQTYLAGAIKELKEKNLKGLYFHPPAKVVPPSELVYNQTLQADLWAFSEKLLKDRGF